MVTAELDTLLGVTTRVASRTGAVACQVAIAEALQSNRQHRVQQHLINGVKGLFRQSDLESNPKSTVLAVLLHAFGGFFQSQLDRLEPGGMR
jgi:hypothetical protein